MTTYKVPPCRIRVDASYHLTYFVGDQEVTKEEFEDYRKDEEAECKRLHKPQNGKRFKRPGLYGDQHDFSREKDPTTGKDGRYMPQLARYPGDPRAVVRHVDQVVEAGKRKGYGIERH
jgi:hypothetical protein